jgi:hypothetical protein
VLEFGGVGVVFIEKILLGGREKFERPMRSECGSCVTLCVARVGKNVHFADYA